MEVHSMIEVLVSSGIVCAFCGIWWKSYIRGKVYNSDTKVTDEMLERFIKINDLDYMDFELQNLVEAGEIKKKYIDTSIVKQIGKELDTGYNFFHIKVRAGYDSLAHRHNYADEFFYVLSGNISIKCGKNDEKIVGQGEYYYVEKEDFHQLTSEKDADFIVISKPPIIVRK